MKRNQIIIIVIILLIAAAIVVWYESRSANAPTQSPETSGTNNTTTTLGTGQGSDEAQIREVLTKFGEQLRFVPLSGTKEIAIQAIRQYYAPFISPELLAAWEKEPTKAPGRFTSSPWPEKIEVVIVDRDDDGSYSVQSKVIEVANGNFASEYQIATKMRKLNGKWTITGLAKVQFGQ